MQIKIYFITSLFKEFILLVIATQCLLKIAALASGKDPKDLNKASKIFEEVAVQSLASRLGQYSAKGYLFQALLCHLASSDYVATQQKVDQFKSLDYSFASSRECDFIEKILVALNNMDAAEFSKACADFDRISPLDPWKTSMLSQVLTTLKSAAGEDDVDLT